jgi:hypothetical protein
VSGLEWRRADPGIHQVDSCYTDRGGDYAIYWVGRTWMVYDGHGHLLQALLPSLTEAKAWCEHHQEGVRP